MCANAEKPEILIGYRVMNDDIERRISQVKYGIEEEGCLYRIYKMINADDIQYSCAEVTVCISQLRGELFCMDIPTGNTFYAVKNNDLKLYRMLGKNAARYLKNISLRMEDGFY